jgi:hypothetical protein
VREDPPKGTATAQGLQSRVLSAWLSLIWSAWLFNAKPHHRLDSIQTPGQQESLACAAYKHQLKLPWQRKRFQQLHLSLALCLRGAATRPQLQ